MGTATCEGLLLQVTLARSKNMALAWFRRSLDSRFVLMTLEIGTYYGQRDRVAKVMD